MNNKTKTLADQIIERSSVAQEEGEEALEPVMTEHLGVPVSLSAMQKDPVNHLAARMILLNRLYVNSIDDSIWNGYTRISETPQTITALANYYDPTYKLPHIYPLVYNRLREVLPRLSRDKLWISPTLLFNRKTGELEEQLPKGNHI